MWRRFLSSARGGATGITAALLAVGFVGGVALIGDHVWIVGKRDLLKSASDAAAMATTQRLGALPQTMSDADVDAALDELARRYVLVNLLPNLPQAAREDVEDSLAVNAAADRALGTVAVTVEADMGGAVLARLLPGSGGGGDDDDDDDDDSGGRMRVGSGVESFQLAAIELVFAIDVTRSMNKTVADGSALLNATACPPVEGASRMAVVKCGAGEILNILARLAAGQTAGGTDADDGGEGEDGDGAEIAADGGGGDADSDDGDGAAAAEPLPVAVGFVPWHYRVRLDETARARWASNGWAAFPAGDRAYPFAYLDGEQRQGTVETLPAERPAAWVGCLDRREAAAGETAPAVLALPGDSPFDQFYWSAQIDRGWERFPAERSVGLACQKEPRRQRFCYIAENGQPLNGAQYPLRPQQPCYATDPATVAPLRADIGAARTYLAALQPSRAPGVGATYSAVGVEWAARLLAPSWNPVWGGGAHPMPAVAADGGRVMKVIVLLTDGEDNHKLTETADAERARACSAARAAGIRIYVIGAANPADKDYESTAASLAECSSQSDDPDGEYTFLNNNDSTALFEAFRRVGRQLVSLRRTF